MGKPIRRVLWPMIYHWMTLAQADGDPNALPRMMFMILMLGLAFYFILWLPEKRKRDDTRKQLESLKENDRIVTVGGIHGTVTNIRRDQQVVTVRVDESTGTKIRLATHAIAQVLTERKADETTEGASSGQATK